MIGYLKKTGTNLRVFLLGVLLFGLPFNFSFQQDEAVFAYNMNNLGRTFADVVQSPDSENIFNCNSSYLRIF